MFEVDKSKLKTSNGMPLTQGLFLEIGYTDYSYYTLKDDDHEHNGHVYPSIKRLYLEMADAGEYLFATTYFLSWDHWQRICNNKLVQPHIEKWRYELELKLRSEAIQLIRQKATTEKGISASKWLAEKGWDKRPAGRPSKEEVERETRLMADIDRDFSDDLKRIAGGS